MSCGEGEWCAYSMHHIPPAGASFNGQRPTANAAGEPETFEDILLRLAGIGDINGSSDR